MMASFQGLTLMIWSCMLSCRIGFGVAELSIPFSLASCKFRTDSFLDIPARRILNSVSEQQCLRECVNYNECLSFNYGSGTCWILGDFLCSHQNRTLSPSPGMKYCDVNKSPKDDLQIPVIMSSEDCRQNGRCDKRCVCYTKDTKELCRFPFIYGQPEFSLNGSWVTNIFYACTTRYSDDGQPWCSTLTDDVDNHVFGHFGHCVEWCPLD